MQQPPLKAIQSGEFEILKYIRDLCDQNGLRYYLAYGTLIGAVRHQGFIPWDDDMDIHMPREDYLRLVEITKKEPHPYYRLISRETSSRFTQILAKMIDSRTTLIQTSGWSEKVPLGLYVDIFVLDGAGNSRIEAEASYLEALSCYKQWVKAVYKMIYPGQDKRITIKNWIKHIPAKILGVRYFMDKHTNICLQKAYDDYEYVGAMAAGTKEPSRNIWKREWFGEGTSVLFNGELFRAPSDWDAVLRPEYGDYMKLPDPVLQHSHHLYKLFIPEPLLKELLHFDHNTEEKKCAF